MTWYHPNYYRKLRAERKKIPVSGTPNRFPGSAENLHSENTKRFVDQAASCKRQAIEETVPHNDIEEAQAASVKPQAPRAKPQAPSSSDPSPKRKVQAPSPE